MPEITPEALGPVGFPFFFIAMWCMVSALISFFGGWWALAQDFPSRDQLPAGSVGIASDIRRYWGSSIKLSFFGNYNSCVTIEVSSEGFSMVPMILFRILHPPIYIPWERIYSIEESPMIFKMFPRAVVTIGDRKIVIMGRAAADILKRGNRSRAGAIPKPLS